MKKVLLVGNCPSEIRELLVENKELVLIHDSNEFDGSEDFFSVLSCYDAAILFEASEFSFVILEELALQNKPILFRDAYEDSEKNKKVSELMARAEKMKLFLKRLELFEAAPLYEELSALIELPVRRVVGQKSFSPDLSEQQLENIAREYLFVFDKLLKKKKSCVFHFYYDEKRLARVEGKVDNIDYTFNVIRSETAEEVITVFFTGGERLSLSDGEITFFPRQGAVKTVVPDKTGYLPIIKPVLNEFVQSIGQI